MRRNLLIPLILLASTNAFAQAQDDADRVISDCSAQAKDKGLIGAERRNFVANCIRTSDPPAVAPLPAKPAGKSKGKPSAEESAIAAAEHVAASSLKDPGSAQFQQIKYNESNGAVCGMLNGKNSYGAYVGFSPFAVDQAGKAYIPVEHVRGINDGDTLRLLKEEKEKLETMNTLCAF